MNTRRRDGSQLNAPLKISLPTGLQNAAIPSVRLDDELAESRNGEIIQRLADCITVIGQVVG